MPLKHYNGMFSIHDCADTCLSVYVYLQCLYCETSSKYISNCSSEQGKDYFFQEKFVIPNYVTLSFLQAKNRFVPAYQPAIQINSCERSLSTQISFHGENRISFFECFCVFSSVDLVARCTCLLTALFTLFFLIRPLYFDSVTYCESRLQSLSPLQTRSYIRSTARWS